MRKFLDITEQKGQMVFTFGRFNPPTTGHEKLIQKVASVAGSNPFRIYPSHSQNPKKDPLPHSLKVAYMRKMFPRYKKNIMATKEKQVFEIVTTLHNQGFTDVIMVVGSDRVKEFESLLTKYNGVNGRHGFYDFKSIDVVSAGERDPDAEGVTGMSASKMRAAATMGDFDSFKLGLPSGFRDGLKLYNDVRKYMGIREERDMGDMNDLETLRDLYLTGKIWNVGDIIEARGIEGKIIRKGTNYLSFVDEEGKVHKAWLYEIPEKPKKITKVKQAPGEVGDVKGTQPAKYYAKGAAGQKMSKSTALSRARFFAKGADKPDDDPDSYKPAPGDKGAKTKPSQYTKKFKQMYGEKDVKIPLELLKLYNKGMKLPAGSLKHKEVMKQIDDMRKKLGIKEKLGKDADAGDYIKDFRKSDKPQFKGKSDKKIRDMAIAAYLDAKDKKEELDMDTYQIDEKIAGLVKKSKQTGVPYSLLKKSYDRGMAAWKTGHRPGTTPQQWAFARVNSMLTGGKADPDLQGQARAAKKAFKAKKKKEELDVIGIKADKESVNEWFVSNFTRASYQLQYEDDWWWKLNEVHDKMLEKIDADCCDDCGEELDEAMYHHVLKGKVVGSGSKAAMQKSVKRHGKTVFKGPDSNYVLNSPGAKIGDIKEEMTSEDSLRNWEHEDAKGYAEKLIDEYGQPDEVTETMLKWNKLGSFGEGERETFVKDESIPHSFPKPHRDYVYTVMNIKVPSNMLDNLGFVTGSIIYDGLKEEVTARCGNLYANAATLGFVKDMVDGKVTTTDKEKAKQEYADRVGGDPLPKWYDNRMNEGVEHMCGHCLDESLWANIHKKRQRIKRGSGERMRKKGEKGAPTAAQMRKAKGESILDYIERRMSTLRTDPKQPNLKIPKRGKAGVTKFQKRAGGRSRLDSPYSMMLKNHWGEITEAAEYQGRKVQLNNPTRGDVKKFKVYVKNDKGNVVKVEFGDPNMEIKRDDPARRKSFRARHNCDNPGPKYKARYWSCKFWEKGKSVSDLMKG